MKSPTPKTAKRLLGTTIVLCTVMAMQPAEARVRRHQAAPVTEASQAQTGAAEAPRVNAASGVSEAAPSGRAVGTARAAGASEAASVNPTSANRGTLNFVDADIESVIAAIGDYTHTTFIIDPRVKGKINLVSDKPLTKSQAFQLLTSVLRMQGYTVVTGPGYSKVVPEADAKLQSGPIQGGAVRGDQIATQVFHLNYESANNLAMVLRPLIAPNNTINANPGNNTLVITDYAENLLRLGKIIAALDSPATTELEVIPIRYAAAGDIAAMVNKLLETGTQVGDAGRLTLQAESRSNSVILRAPSEARARLAKSLIEKLDQPTAQPGNVHVVYLRNAEAAKLAVTLRAVISADTSAPAAAGQPAAAAAAGGAAGAIQADAATNTLIITASEPVYRNMRAIIDQLDARRAQVYIESLIVEVSAQRAAEFGIQWAGATGDAASRIRVGGLSSFAGTVAGDNLASQGAAAAAGSVLPPGNGLTVGIFRQDPVTGAIGLGAMARALASDDDANILSMPNLVTLDNEEAKIIVGQNVPFITGQYTTAASGGSANVNPFQTVERKDIGLSLRVKPQISEGGTVKMAIYQETSSVQDTTNPAGIITNKRSIDTNVLVDDGEIIVLGGLIDDTQSDSVSKVPLLGDIPLLGNLFKYQKRSRKKTNLMVFLRPTVIRNNEQSVNLSSERYDYIRNAQGEAQPETKLTLPNYGAPLLPPLQENQKRKTGQPSGPAAPALGTTPNPPAPDQSAPAQTAPGQTAPGQTAPGQTAPAQTAPSGTQGNAPQPVPKAQSPFSPELPGQ
jgi:general secretion pathway protein D